MDSIKNQISQYLKENFMMAEDFSESESLLEHGIIDSTGVLELILFLEETFGIKVGDEEIVPDNLDSINYLVTFIQNKTNI